MLQSHEILENANWATHSRRMTPNTVFFEVRQSIPKFMTIFSILIFPSISKIHWSQQVHNWHRPLILMHHKSLLVTIHGLMCVGGMGGWGGLSKPEKKTE